MPQEDRAKKYCNIKYFLSLFSTVYLFVLLCLFQVLGFSSSLSVYLKNTLPKDFFIIPAYLAAVYILYYVLSFPLNLYRYFILEHRFCLTNQKIGDWFKDQAKAGVIAYIFFLILFEAFYFILEVNPAYWWLVVSLFWIFFNLVLAKLTPIIIIPLFFKYKRLSDETLRERIFGLAGKIKIKILDVFEIDFSKKTLKANAAFVGWGNTRRVILADTLKEKYSYDEIEVILAHEFAHYKLKHLIKLMLINSFTIIVVFYFIFKSSNYVLAFFAYQSLSDIAAIPVVIIYFIVFGVITAPLANYLSRTMETNADKKALEITGLKDAFISTMDKLAKQNLADRSPHAVIKFFFFDHPPIDERIEIAKSF